VGLGQVDPQSGIDFVTVGAVGNAPYAGPPGLGSNVGRGRVDYEYRIGRTEITTAQWAEFYNAAFDRPSTDRIPFVSAPLIWGGQSTTPNTPGGRRWTVPAGREMFAAGGVTWRTAAIYCNWLHNGKGTNREAFLSGAYDVSTFGTPNGGISFVDQLTRSAGARYWVPSIDEWIKAAHYDPQKVNADGSVGGWWEYPHSREDRAPVYGPPGQLNAGRPTEANAAWNDLNFPGFSPFAVPLGAYPLSTSPWGLLDTSGGTAEWTEAVFQERDEIWPRSRYTDGAAWAFGPGGDTARNPSGSLSPGSSEADYGFRIASIPSPGAVGLVMAFSVVACRNRRRRNHAEKKTCVVACTCVR
jgi:formylglycine-generating enzyme required for sulfatase activity